MPRPALTYAARMGLEGQASGLRRYGDQTQSVDAAVVGAHQEHPPVVADQQPQHGFAGTIATSGRLLPSLLPLVGSYRHQPGRQSEVRLADAEVCHPLIDGFGLDRNVELELRTDAPSGVGVAVQPHHLAGLVQGRESPGLATVMALRHSRSWVCFGRSMDNRQTTVMADPRARPAVQRGGIAADLLRTARPAQWIKNLLVVAAPVLSGRVDEGSVQLAALVAFWSFCLAASGTYLVNDARDVRLDREHPTKRHRPVAAGRISSRSAYVGGAVLLVASLGCASLSGRDLVLVTAVYGAASLLYTFWLKDEPVFDIAIIASGFLLRAIAGGAAADIPLSRWFLLAASFGSLFMASGKRYAESEIVSADQGHFRTSLTRYTSTYLRFVWTLSASVLIMTYGLWAFEQADRNGSSWTVISMAPFVLAVLRYAMDVDVGRAGEPEEIARRDHILQGLAAVWLLCMVMAIY